MIGRTAFQFVNLNENAQQCKHTKQQTQPTQPHSFPPSQYDHSSPPQIPNSQNTPSPADAWEDFFPESKLGELTLGTITNSPDMQMIEMPNSLKLRTFSFGSGNSVNSQDKLSLFDNNFALFDNDLANFSSVPYYEPQYSKNQFETQLECQYEQLQQLGLLEQVEQSEDSEESETQEEYLYFEDSKQTIEIEQAMQEIQEIQQEPQMKRCAKQPNKQPTKQQTKPPAKQAAKQPAKQQAKPQRTLSKSQNPPVSLLHSQLVSQQAAEKTSNSPNSPISFIVQPAQFARFRYHDERGQRIEGENGVIEVGIDPGVIRHGHNVSITVSAITSTGKPHWHELGGKTQYISLEKLKTTQVKFPELQIFMDTKKNKQHKHEKEENRVVKLLFTLTYSLNGNAITSNLISRPIINTTLELTNISHSSGPCTGGNKVFILGQKFDTKRTCVVLESQYTGNISSNSQWISKGSSCTLALQPSSPFLEFHHQYAIIVTIPPFHDQEILEAVKVLIRVENKSDNTVSNAVEYQYLPSEHTWRTAEKMRKRQRYDDDAKKFYDDMSGNFDSGSGNSRNSNSNSGSGSGSNPNNSSNSTSNSNASTRSASQGESSNHSNKDVLSVRYFSALGDVKYLLAGLRQAIEEKDENGDTALNHSITQGQDDVAIQLAKIVNPLLFKEQNHHGDTPLHLAVWHQNHKTNEKDQAPISREELIKVLTSSGSFNPIDSQGRTPLHIAAINNNSQAIHSLVNAFQNYQKNNSNEQEQSLETILSSFCYSGLTPLLASIHHGNDEAFSALLLSGASLKDADQRNGQNSIMYAAKLESLNIIQEMVKSSQWDVGHLKLKDFSGNTALHHAVLCNNIPMISYLLQIGADPDIVNLNGKDCFDIAEQRELEKALLILREKAFEDSLSEKEKMKIEEMLTSNNETPTEVPNDEAQKQRDIMEEPPAYSNEESDWELLEPMQIVDEFNSLTSVNQSQSQLQFQFRNERNRALSQISSLFHGGEKRERALSYSPSIRSTKSAEFRDRKQGLANKSSASLNPPKRYSSVN